MSDFLQVSEDEFVPLHSVRRIRAVTDKDRASLSSLGAHVQAERFQTRIEKEDGSNFYAPASIEQIIAQSIVLIEISDNGFVPLKNIQRMKALTSKDRSRFEKRIGKPMPEEFKSRIETCAGSVLSSLDCKTIMQRMNRPFNDTSQNASGPVYLNKSTSSENGGGLLQARDEVMNRVNKGESQ